MLHRLLFLALPCLLSLALVTAPAADSTLHFPALINFSMEGCAPCKQMQPIIAKLQSEQSTWLRVENISLSSPETKALAKHFHITSVPTQILVDSTGHALATHSGAITEPELLQSLADCGLTPQTPPTRGPQQPLSDWVASIQPLPSAPPSPAPRTSTISAPTKDPCYRAYYLHETERSACSGAIESDTLSILKSRYNTQLLSFETLDIEEPANEPTLDQLQFSSRSDLTRGICVVVKIVDGTQKNQVALDDLVTYKDDTETLQTYILEELQKLEK